MPPSQMWCSVMSTAREIARLAGAQPAAPQQLEQSGLRKFRRAAGAAIHRIDDAAELLRGVIEFGGADRDACRACAPRRRAAPSAPRDSARSSAAPRETIARSRAARRRRPACRNATNLRKVSAAPDRFAVGREEHGQRPAALLAEMMQRRHVDLIDVGPLLAIDFDVDEQLIHHRRGVVVLEALVRHHVAPVAGRIADREQDRLSCCFASASASGPTATNRPGCPCAGADTGWFRARGGFPGGCVCVRGHCHRRRLWTSEAHCVQR